MDRQNKGDGKKKVLSSGSKARGRGSQSRADRVVQVCHFNHNSVIPHTLSLHIFFAQTTQLGFYNTQHQPNYPPQGPTMVTPGVYEYPTDAQNAFDPFAYWSPPTQYPRDNVEHMLPIYNDNEDEEFVSRTQNLDEDENEDYAEQEEELEVEDEAENEPKGKGVRRIVKVGRRNKKRC
ncbi:hypothetical protein HanPI659440_Chr13g0507801 [Helianthus annuus]|nr:hypothetical protein HanPI659440_Chr13g0507801 [Helianthus annuus]